MRDRDPEATSRLRFSRCLQLLRFVGTRWLAPSLYEGFMGTAALTELLWGEQQKKQPWCHTPRALGRRLAVTHGNHLALVPAQTQVGDRVVLIEGAQYP